MVQKYKITARVVVDHEAICEFDDDWSKDDIRRSIRGQFPDGYSELWQDGCTGQYVDDVDIEEVDGNE